MPEDSQFFQRWSLANAALPKSSPVTGDTFCYSGHAYASYQRQGQHSVLLVMYSIYNAFCYYKL